MKPIIYVANIKEDEIGKENSYVKDLKDHANKDNAEVIVLCAKINIYQKTNHQLTSIHK